MFGNMDNRKKHQKKKLKQDSLIVAFIKFLPLLLFATLVLIMKLDLLIAASIATFGAIIVYMLSSKVKFCDAFINRDHR